MGRSETFSELVVFVQRDNEIRSYAISELGMKPEYELFIFGRPLVAILKDHGLTVRTPDKDEL
jgi:hypothetical protein